MSVDDKLIDFLNERPFAHVSLDMAHDPDEKRFKAATERPFTGQAHTGAGERGKLELRGVRMRDVADAVTTALHRLDVECDDECVAQNVCCLLEHLMGVYPNLRPSDKPCHRCLESRDRCSCVGGPRG